MNFTILIPARSGSKRIKNKNLRLFNNFPLIYWTIRAAKKSKIKDIYISTDSKKIMEFGLSHDVKVPFLRPNSISDDKAKMIDVIKHFCDFFEKKKKIENLILLQPTSPLRTYKDINSAVDIFLNFNPASLVSAYKSNEQKEFKKIMKVNKNYIQEFCDIGKENFIVRNGPSILITKLDNIMSNKLYGTKIMPFMMKKSLSIDIDTLEEFYIAEHIHKKLKMGD